MKKVGIAVASVVLSISGAAFADIIVTAPDKEVRWSDSLDSLTLTIQLTGNYDLDSYELDLRLAGRDGAAGVTFNGAAEAPGYFLAGNTTGWATAIDQDFRIYGDDGTASPPETLVDTPVLAVITVGLALGLDIANVGDVYDVTFNTGLSAVYEYKSPSDPIEEFPDVTWKAGTITVIPEPVSTVFLALGGLALIRRRKA